MSFLEFIVVSLVSMVNYKKPNKQEPKTLELL